MGTSTRAWSCAMLALALAACGQGSSDSSLEPSSTPPSGPVRTDVISPPATAGIAGGVISATGSGGEAGQVIELDPRMFDVWYFGWTGDNLSFAQVALCSDGTAAYLFAEDRSEVGSLRAQAPFTALGPTRVRVDFDVTIERRMVPAAHTELQYDADTDMLIRMPVAGDLYDSRGRRFSEFEWSEPSARCP